MADKKHLQISGTVAINNSITKDFFTCSRYSKYTGNGFWKQNTEL